jgi:hypothetical protein
MVLEPNHENFKGPIKIRRQFKKFDIRCHLSIPLGLLNDFTFSNAKLVAQSLH